jgi:hypothetical protein
MINDCYFSNIEDNVKNYNTEKKRRVSRQRNTFIFDENKNKDKNINRKNKRYSSIDVLTQKKLKKHSKAHLERFSSMHLMKDLNSKNKIKSNYYEDTFLDSNNKRKIEEERYGLKETNRNIHHKRKKYKSKKENKIKTSMSSKNNDIFKIDHKIKKSDNLYLDNKDNNFEDNNYISHQIKSNKEKLKQENNTFGVKSSRHFSQKQFLLIKEVDRNYEALDQINKVTESDKKVRKSLKHKLKKNNKNFKKKKSQKIQNLKKEENQIF